MDADQAFISSDAPPAGFEWSTVRGTRGESEEELAALAKAAEETVAAKAAAEEKEVLLHPPPASLPPFPSDFDASVFGCTTLSSVRVSFDPFPKQKTKNNQEVVCLQLLFSVHSKFVFSCIPSVIFVYVCGDT